MAASLRDKGRLILSRKIEASWQWQEPLTRSAWVWMLMKAAYKSHNGLNRGQFYFSVRQGPQVWGMSETETRRFLNKLANGGAWNNYHPEIVWQKSKGGRQLKKDGAVPGYDDGYLPGGVPSIITICNYDQYNRLLSMSGAEPGAEPGGANNCASVTLHNEKESNKESKNYPDSDESVTPNSQVYNFFIEQKRKAHDRPEWLPTAAQAKQLRANIRVLIEKQGFQSDDLISWLNNFFSDEKVIEAGWPWRFFMTDPVKWKEARASPNLDPEERPRVIIDKKALAAEKERKRREFREGK